MAGKNVSVVLAMILQLLNTVVVRADAPSFSFSVWTLSGFLVGDLVLTLSLVILTYAWALRRRGNTGSKVLMKKMSNTLCNADSVTDCTSCYQTDMGSVTAIVSCDIALTLLVCVLLLGFVLYQKKRARRDSTDGHLKPASSKSKRKGADVPESPYQELHGVQADVYSNLQELR